jgi:hydroxyethylthiazole kinase-like uncharacterized protein yjeF
MRLPARLFKRPADANKGDFGHVFILAGSRCFTGAAGLCANAALRAGAGLATLGIPESLHPIFASRLTEVMTLPLPQTKEASLSEKALRVISLFLKKADCLLIGPGLSQNISTQRLIRSVVQAASVPLVIDADGLNALAGHLDILKKLKNELILTPHPREFSRLASIPVQKVQEERKQVAKDFALRYNMTLVLKGNRTVVASPQGRIYINPTGNPGMATAGSGDVLAGIIAAFLAQGFNCFDSARMAVYLHGLAGDLAAKDKTEISLIASDIIEYLPKAFKKCKV